MQARYDPEGALQRPAGGSPAPVHAVRLIDLPQYDTDSAAIEKRMTGFLTGLRERRLLLVPISAICGNGSEVLAPAAALCPVGPSETGPSETAEQGPTAPVRVASR